METWLIIVLVLAFLLLVGIILALLWKMKQKKGPQEFECPKCSSILLGLMDKCPKCGHNFVVEKHVCPHCKKEVPGDASICDACGTEFQF